MAAAHDLKNWITHVQSPRVEKWLKDAAMTSDNHSSRRRQSLFPVCLGNGCCAEAGVFYDPFVQ